MIDIEPPDVQPAKPGRWVVAGLRSALFLQPDFRGLRASPGLLAALLLGLLLCGIGVQRLAIQGAAVFYWQALASGWVGTLTTLWVCWIVTHSRQRDAVPEPGVQPVATLFGVLVAQSWIVGMCAWFAYMMLGAMGDSELTRWAMWSLTPLMLSWTLAASIRLLWPRAAVRAGPRLALLGALFAGTGVAAFAPGERYWYPAPAAHSDRDPSARFSLSQEGFETQAQVFAAQLAGLAPQREGVVDLYSLTVAPYASEDVFARESALVTEVMRAQFDADGRTMQLVNHTDTAGRFAWATSLNVQRTIAAMARVMNRDEDVLFIHLTSHGGRDGKLAASFWPLQVDSVTASDLKRWLDDSGVRFRVVSVSACFSGTWLEPLRDEHTLIMTASDAEHTSYGCGRRSELTYFGRAVFDEQLRRTTSFESAHAAARPIIEQREKQAGKSDGYSNPQIHVGGAVRAQLALLEARLAVLSQR